MSDKEIRIEKEFCKYHFTEQEKKELSVEMAQKTIEAGNLEDEIKSIKARYKGDIEAAMLLVKSNASKIRDGFDMRYIPCEVVPDYSRGVFRFIRQDTGEEVRERKMTAEDRQQSLL